MGFWEPLFFWFFALGALVTSCAVIAVRNPLYCVLALIVDFFFLAGIYILLSAHFLAVVQILVYGGAIMVLFLFIIMLLNLRDEELGENRFQLHHIPAILGAVAIFFFIGGAILAGTDVDSETLEQASAQVGDDGELLPPLPVSTQIPGLYLTLDEESLEEGFEAQLAGWQSGALKPSDGKYPRFNPEQSFELPPSLQPMDEQYAVTPERAGLYGTFRPLSVLLVNRFVVPFELTAILLLGAIVGAVIIAKRRIT